MTLKPLHIFYAALISLCWGLNAPIIKMVITEVPPLPFSTIRCLLLGFLVVFFPKPNLPFKTIWLFALLHGMKITLLYYALTFEISSGISTVLLQTQSLFAVLLAVLFCKEKVSLTSAFGLLFSFSGVCLLGLNLHGEGTLWAMLLILLSAFIAALSFLVMRNHKKVHYLSFIGYFNLVSVIPFLLATFWVDGYETFWTITHSMTLYSWSLLVCSAITVIGAYAFLVYLLSIYPMSQVTPYLLLVPVFGLSGGYVCLGEMCSLYGWIGSIIVIIGLAINQYGAIPQKLTH